MGPDSLNRAVRNKEIVRVAEANHSFLDRLQKATSHYSAVNWEKDYSKVARNTARISENANRFSKNPYFLHSVTSTEINPYGQDLQTPMAMPAGRAQSRGRRGMSAKPGSGSSGNGGRRRRVNSANVGLRQRRRKIPSEQYLVQQPEYANAAMMHQTDDGQQVLVNENMGHQSQTFDGQQQMDATQEQQE